MAEQGAHHLHTRFLSDLEIRPLAAGDAGQIVANQVRRPGSATAYHEELDLVAVDVAAPLAAQGQIYAAVRLA